MQYNTALKTGMILDTDIGFDPDDLFALLLLLNSPEIELDLIVTANEVGGRRAIFAKQILKQCGHEEIPVVQGVDLGNREFVVDELIGGVNYQVGTEFVEAMRSVIDATEYVIYIGIGGFTNLAHLIRAYPRVSGKLKVYQMGGALNSQLPHGQLEYNVRVDPESARYVISSGLNVSLVVCDTTRRYLYQVNDRHRIFEKLALSNKPIHQTLARHCQLFHKKVGEWPYMHDPLTVSAAMGKGFVDFEECSISMDESGGISRTASGHKICLSKPESRADGFMQFLENAMFA